jgi:hypothetical protein
MRPPLPAYLRGRECDSASDLVLIEGMARRFHELALSRRYRPHRATAWELNNEWDCQYLFHAILAAYFRDIRPEESDPSTERRSLWNWLRPKGSFKP